MKKSNRNLFLLLLCLVITQCTRRKPEDMFLSKEYVNLGGSDGITIIKNITSDSLKLSGEFFTQIPVRTYPFQLNLAPGEEDTLVFRFNYPDFINIDSHQFRIFNAPGKTLRAKIIQTGNTPQIRFEGDLASINDYYLAYQNHFGSFTQEHAPYYAIGEKLNDLNKFPALADSINNLNLKFLEGYDQPLPSWFKLHESWRLKYNASFRKYNVPFSKGFYSGSSQKLESSYYDFDKSMPLDNPEVILNTEYLHYAMFRIHRLSPEQKTEGDAMIATIDKTVSSPRVADLLKFKRTLDAYEQSRSEYTKALRNLSFIDSGKTTLLDSIIITRSGKPNKGRPCPAMNLVDLKNNKISLSDFTGKYVIINFWASWCGPCLEELEFESNLHNQYKDRGLYVVNVCVDTDESRWRGISANKKMTMINLFADPSSFEKIKADFDLNGLPRSILVDPAMNVVDNYFSRASRLTEKDLTFPILQTTEQALP